MLPRGCTIICNWIKPTKTSVFSPLQTYCDMWRFCFSKAMCKWQIKSHCHVALITGVLQIEYLTTNFSPAEILCHAVTLPGTPAIVVPEMYFFFNHCSFPFVRFNLSGLHSIRSSFPCPEWLIARGCLCLLFKNLENECSQYRRELLMLPAARKTTGGLLMRTWSNNNLVIEIVGRV